MHLIFAIFVAIVNIAICLSLQFVSPPPDHVFKLFSSPRSKDQAQENTIVIQSKPYNVNGSGTTPSDYSKLRRNIHIQRGDISDENFTEPKLPAYALDCGNDKICLEAHGLDPPEPTFKPYTQEELERLLTKYTASNGSPPKVEDNTPKNKLANLYMDEEETVINVLETNTNSKDQEKSKAANWHLLQSQKHNHPYDDQKGWVTLEAVPWAQSQIQKWEPHTKPQVPSWEHPHQQHGQTSHWDSRPPAAYSTQRPWTKPAYEYKPSRPQWTRPSHWGPNTDIITDNQPGYFPGSQQPWHDQESYSSNKPAQIYSEGPSHPFRNPVEGEGQWVLLSSTKGYSFPNRDRNNYQRALKIPAETVSSHRAVRLTVLPAGNSTNSTFSHGGLLEVESTLQTVEEAQKEHAAKMLKLESLQLGQPSPISSGVRANKRHFEDRLQVFAGSPADSAQSKTAMLAAVGAGIIPATMAMLLPMVLGRRKRSPGQELNSNRTMWHPQLLHVKQTRKPHPSLRNTAFY